MYDKEFGAMPHGIFVEIAYQDARYQVLGWESVIGFTEGACKMYEEFLKGMNPNCPSTHIVSISCLILLTIWQILAVFFTKLTWRHTSHIAETRAKTVSMCSPLAGPTDWEVNKLEALGGWWRGVDRIGANVLCDNNPVSTLLTDLKSNIWHKMSIFLNLKPPLYLCFFLPSFLPLLLKHFCDNLK